MTDSTRSNDNENSTNENSVSENSSNVNSDLNKNENKEIENSNQETNQEENKNENTNHKYDSSKSHLDICEICRQTKKKINDEYYKNNTDKILAKRKTDRLEKLNKSINEINDPSKTEKIILSNDEKDLASQIPIQEIDPRNYMLKQTMKYIFPKGLERLIKKYGFKKQSKGLIFYGHAGNGKTEAGKQYSIKNKIPCVFMSLHNDIRSTDLLGSFSLKNGSSVFVLGKLIEAIQIANSHPSKTCVLILDEINTMDNNVQKILNTNLDFRSGINIPLVNRQYRLNEDSKIIVLATMNPSSYSGTYPLNLELNSRFDHKEIKVMPDKLIRDLLKAQNIDSKTIESLLITQKEILKAFEAEKLDQPIDPRGLIKFAEDYNLNVNEFKMDHVESLREALELTLVGRFLDNKEDLKFVNEIIESNFSFDELDQEDNNKTETENSETE